MDFTSRSEAAAHWIMVDAAIRIVWHGFGFAAAVTALALAVALVVRFIKSIPDRQP